MNSPITPSRFPWRLALGTAMLLLALLLFVQLHSALDPEARAAAETARWRQSQLDDRLEGLDVLLAAAWRVLPLVLVAGGAGLAGALVWRRWGWRESVYSDKVISLTRAQYQTLPALTSLTLHQGAGGARVHPLPALVAPEAAAPALPGPLDLASLDLRPSKERIVLAVDEHGPIAVSVAQLCHVALLGATGGGKSNLLRLILPQLQALGAGVVLADPHYAPVDPENGDDWRPIARQLRFAPAVHAAEIDQLLDFMTEELARRLEKRNHGESVGAPLFLAFDELPTIADLVPDATQRIGKLLREGRKVHLLTVGASQSMLVKEVGGSSALRDQYRTACYVGGDRKSAAAILDLPERAIDDGPLGKGVILLRSEATRPARLVRVPLVSNDSLYDLLGGETPNERSTVDRPSFGFRPAPKSAPAESPLKVDESRLERGESRIAESPQTARILALFQEGLSVAEIVKELFGLTSGAKYNAARAEVEATIRAALCEVG